MSLNSILKRIKTENNADVKLSNIDDIADSTSATSKSIITEDDDANSFINVFTEDILPEIMDNLEILTIKDLLNLRLVNRCWRNAATSVLLKRNLCEIGLDFGEVVIDEDDNAVGQVMQTFTLRNNFENIPPSYKYFNVYKPRRILSDLNQLISTSSKFPSTSIRFYSKCWRGFGNLCRISEYNEAKQHQIDLFHFFSLYGKKIKRLSLSCNISERAVQNLLYVHMPHLICLDLEDCAHFLAHHDEESQLEVCLPLSSTLEIREIVMSHESAFLGTKSNFVKELITVCPKLSSIKNMDASAFNILLEIDKCHLLKDLHINPTLSDFSTIEPFIKPLRGTILMDKLLSLKLTKLTVQFSNIKDFYNFYHGMVTFLNIILSVSRDSLKHLEIYMNSSITPVIIFIPPLLQLRHLYLVDFKNKSKTRFQFLGDIIGRVIQAGKVACLKSIYDLGALSSQKPWSSSIPADYFPRLHQVKLSKGVTNSDSDKLLEFFSLDNIGPYGVTLIPGDVLPTVTTLNLSPWDSSYSRMSKLFPNVVNLEISVNDSDVLQNWVWTAFSKLVRFKISAVGHEWSTTVVDSFFTGISQELCATFETEETATDLGSGPAQVSERTQPYIGDCRNLMELKIIFWEKLNSKFASKVTAVHGFQDVIHRTKIIFSFEEVNLSEEEIEETRQILAPVSAYVEIRNYNSLP